MPDYQPDLTGEAPENYIDTYQRTIWKPGQQILFDQPVFHNNKLELLVIGSPSVAMVEGVDYVVNPMDIHEDAMGFCKSIDPQFGNVLLKSITIIKTFIGDYKIQVKYNQLFADEIRYTKLNSTSNTIEVTPTLISNMVEEIDYLQQMVLNVSDSYSVQSGETRVLEIDVTGSLPDNLVETELHDINSINDVIYINPVYGAFYAAGLIVKNHANGQDVNYKLHEADLAKTHNSSEPSGVFRSLEITDVFVGEVEISYQAYGGSTDVVSMNTLKDKQIVLEQFLSQNSFITPGTLHADPTIIGLINKIADMEGQMRLLLQNGLPTYGDVSTNTSVRKKLIALDANHHWWSIASLYRVEGSNDNVISDTFKFRLQSLYTKLMLECSVAVNADPNYNGERITISCDNANIPSDVLLTALPKLRIIEVTGSGEYSGVILQMGIRLGSGILQETLAVEDMSGKESCWVLDTFVAPSINPQDTAVLMPEGTLVYTDGDANNLKDEVDIPYPSGVIVTRPVTNISLSITAVGAATVLNDDDANLYQEVGDLDWVNLRSVDHEYIVDVAGAATPIKINLPVTFTGLEGNLIEFRNITEISGCNMELIFTLFYDGSSGSYKMRTVIKELTSVVAPTMNLTKVTCLL